MRRVTGTMLVAFGFMLPAMSEAAVLNEQELQSQSASTVRPCSDFLDAQGSTSTFFPPVPDYVGWTDGASTTFALVDYAGLAGEYLEGHELRPRPECVVRERKLDDGTAEITVVLRMARALGFAQSVAEIIANGFDFDITPTIFGEKAKDVEGGATPAVGPARLNVSFVIAAPGAALPDLLDVVNTCDYVPVQLNFESLTNGRRPDHTRAQLRVGQEASTPADGCTGDTQLTYTREVVEIESVPRR